MGAFNSREILRCFHRHLQVHNTFNLFLFFLVWLREQSFYVIYLCLVKKTVLCLVNQIYLSKKMCGFLTYTIVPNIYLKFSSDENFQHVIGLGSCENFELIQLSGIYSRFSSDENF